MEKADGLSRRPDWQEEVEKDNKDQKLIKPEKIREAETIIEEENLKERIKKAQEGCCENLKQEKVSHASEHSN